jgi:hypothetical protein
VTTVKRRTGNEGSAVRIGGRLCVQIAHGIFVNALWIVGVCTLSAHSMRRVVIVPFFANLHTS